VTAPSYDLSIRGDLRRSPSLPYGEFEAVTDVEGHDAAADAHHEHESTEHLVRVRARAGGIGLGLGLGLGLGSGLGFS